MRKKLLLAGLLLLFCGAAHAQSQIKIALGGSYAGGNATATMIVPIETGHGLQTLFLDTNGHTIFATLLQGNVYFIKVCDVNGWHCLGTTIIPNGNTQDISSMLLSQPYAGSGGGGSPGGSTTQVQFNDAGSFGGASAWTYDKTLKLLTGTAGSDTQTPLLINAHSPTQTASLLTINTGSAVTPRGALSIMGIGGGTDCDWPGHGSGNKCFIYMSKNADIPGQGGAPYWFIGVNENSPGVGGRHGGTYWLTSDSGGTDAGTTIGSFGDTTQIAQAGVDLQMTAQAGLAQLSSDYLETVSQSIGAVLSLGRDNSNIGGVFNASASLLSSPYSGATLSIGQYDGTAVLAGGLLQFDGSGNIILTPKSGSHVNLPSLGASLPVCTDGAKNLITTSCGSIVFSPDVTNTESYYAPDSGTTNAYVISPSPVVAGLLTNGLSPSMLAANNNTGASTLTVTGLSGATNAIVKNSPTGFVALTGGEIVSGQVYHFTWIFGHGFVIADPSTPFSLSQTIAKGTIALGTPTITSGSCATAVTATATGTATTDVVRVSFNGDVTGIVGYQPLTSGVLTIFPYPTANTVNVKVCNMTSSSVTPGAVTLNFQVIR